MELFNRSPAVGFEQPFEMLEACHERVQRSLDLLGRLIEHVAARGHDEQSRSAAHDLLRYFDLAAPHHHAPRRTGDNAAMTLPPPPHRPLWQRASWTAAGALSLALGVIGIFLPLLPTTPFVLLAAFCFSRGSERIETWLTTHPRFGPMVADWRERRAIPRRAKHLAWAMMAVGSAWAGWVMPTPWRWLPALVCIAVAAWMWQLPDADRR